MTVAHKDDCGARDASESGCDVNIQVIIAVNVNAGRTENISINFYLVKY